MSAADLRQTPLHDLHVELGAKMAASTDVLDALAAPVGVLLRDRKAA